MSNTNTSTAKSPFTTSIFGEVISNDFISQQGCELITSMIGLSLCFGIDRVEAAIKNTYPKDGAESIISSINYLLKIVSK